MSLRALDRHPPEIGWVAMWHENLLCPQPLQRLGTTRPPPFLRTGPAASMMPLPGVAFDDHRMASKRAALSSPRHRLSTTPNAWPRRRCSPATTRIYPPCPPPSSSSRTRRYGARNGPSGAQSMSASSGEHLATGNIQHIDTNDHRDFDLVCPCPFTLAAKCKPMIALPGSSPSVGVNDWARVRPR